MVIMTNIDRVHMTILSPLLLLGLLVFFISITVPSIQVCRLFNYTAGLIKILSIRSDGSYLNSEQKKAADWISSLDHPLYYEPDRTNRNQPKSNWLPGRKMNVTICL